MEWPYTADDIKPAQGLEPIRRWPSQYFGDTTDPDAVNVLLRESLCIALDFMLSGHATELTIRLDGKRSAMVTDNTRGFPVEPQDCGKTLTEIVFGEMVPGCRHHKQDPKNADLCGPGMACVTALSEWLTVDNRHEGVVWRTRFVRGVQQGLTEKVGPTEASGLQISFLPDRKFFGDRTFNSNRFVEWFNDRAFPLPDNARVRFQAAGTDSLVTLHPRQHG